MREETDRWLYPLLEAAHAQGVAPDISEVIFAASFPAEEADNPIVDYMRATFGEIDPALAGEVKAIDWITFGRILRDRLGWDDYPDYPPADFPRGERVMANEWLEDPEHGSARREVLQARNRHMVKTTITWYPVDDEPLPVEPGFVVDVEPPLGLLRAVRCLHCGDIVWSDPQAETPNDGRALTDWLLTHDCRAS